MKINNISTINTSGQNRSKFNHLPSEQYRKICFKGCDLLELTEKDIFQRIEESVNYENFLGQGTEAEVYRIKDSDYCVRIPYTTSDLYKYSFTKKLNPIDKLNHVVAKLGFGASILKFLEGETPKKHKDNMLLRYQLQEKISNMPIKSYSELLHQIADAIDNEMFFDYSGGNLIVNTKENKLTAIDFYGLTDNPKPVSPLSEMYQVLTCYGAEKNTGKKIFDNVILSGLEEFKPNIIPCMDVELFDFTDLCLKRVRDNSSGESCKYTELLAPQFSLLKKIKKNEIVNKKAAESLEKQIIKITNFIKHIH